MTYKELDRKIRTAGTWFVGSFMREFIIKYPEYKNSPEDRCKFIEYIHSEYGENCGYTYDSTKTKCYAVIAIIEAGKVMDALEYVFNSNENKVAEGTIENAQYLLDEIIAGKITLPELKEKEIW